MKLAPILSFSAAALCVVACSSSTGSVAEDLSIVSPSCPASPPANGSACADLGAQCSWGDDARFGCRTLATCGDWQNDKVWVVTNAACPEPPPSCPESQPKGDGGFDDKCSDAHLGLTCVYGDAAYTCTPCSGTLCMNKNHWSVTTLETGCPTATPNLGASCSSPGLWCDYNICADDQLPGQQWAFGIAMKCRGGAWVLDGGDQVCL